MKKYFFDQSGRSMIEMLGVLAIVGVRSVAGITGYSKAMAKYKTNKLIGSGIHRRGQCTHHIRRAGKL